MPDIAGLKLIVPTSATATGSGSSATVSATGKVTFSLCTKLSINGCFSSAYENYLVVMRHTITATDDYDLFGYLRASGTDNTTASSYTYQRLNAENTAVNGARTSQAYFRDLQSARTAAGHHIYFYGPYLTQPTAIRGVNVDSRSSAAIRDVAVTHNQSTAYDGFTLEPAGSSVNGALCVYGLSQ